MHGVCFADMVEVDCDEGDIMTTTSNPDPMAAEPMARLGRSWVPPLETVVTLDVTEYTRPSSNPGNDGNGTSTAS